MNKFVFNLWHEILYFSYKIIFFGKDIRCKWVSQLPIWHKIANCLEEIR